MNKLFSKIAALSVGLAMAVGVSLVVGGNKAARVHAADTTVSWTATAANNLGSQISGKGGTASGSVTLTDGGSNSYSLNYTRTLVNLANNKSDYIAFQGSTWIQLGSSNALESLSFTTSAIPGTIKSVSVTTATAGTHKLTIDVGGTKYKDAADIQTYSGAAAAANPSPANCVSTGTGTSSGALTITIASSATTNKAMVIRSVSVTYTDSPVQTYTVSFNGNGGTGDMSSVSEVFDNYTLPDCAFTAPSGKVFSGWKAGNAGDLIAAGGSYNVTADVTFFAQWVDAYTVTYSAGTNGTGSFAHEAQPVGMYTLLPFASLSGVLANTGYQFKNYTVGGVDKDPGDTFSLSANTIVTVNFETEPLHVTLDNIGSTLGTTLNETMNTVDITDGDNTYTLNYLQSKKQNNAIFMAKSVGAFVSNHTEMPGDIVSVEVFINSGAAAATTYDVAFGASEFTAAAEGVGAVNITGGNSHVFEANVASSRYFCISLGNANNGQVLKIVVIYENSVDPSKKNMTIYTSGNPADGGTIQWSKNAGTHVFSAKEEETTVSGVTWSTSDSTVATINASTGAMTTVKAGNVVVYAEAEGYNKASATVTISKGWKVESVTVTGSMTKTSYSVGEEWSHSGLVATAEWNTGYEEDVSSTATWTYNPASPASDVTSVVATATFDEVSGNSAAQVVTVSRTNPIQAIYTKTSGASVDVYGYYVGFLDGTGPVIMDGEYGVVVFDKTADVSGYTAGTTILHVTGSVSIYKGLYEIGSASISVASGTYDTPLTPVVYTTDGNETAEYASRLTTVTGTATVTSGSFDSAAGTADIKMDFTVGTKTVQVFYKKAAQTADSECFAAIKDAVANSTEITIKGFTGWYNGFQVQMNGYVPPVVGYTAEDFAQDLLDQTDDICEGYDGVTNNKAALLLVWNDLASADKYPSLPSAEKTKLAEAERDESGDVVERAMARYDYLTGKYNLTNFINGRTPVEFANQMSFETGNNSMAIIIVIASVSGLIVVGTLLILKKKRHN